MSQRNIDDTMIKLVTQFGDYSPDGDKIILNKNHQKGGFYQVSFTV